MGQADSESHEKEARTAYNRDRDSYGRERADTWIERVRWADAEAERAWRAIPKDPTEYASAVVLRAIAAELRAQRIARRPEAGQ